MYTHDTGVGVLNRKVTSKLDTITIPPFPLLFPILSLLSLIKSPFIRGEKKEGREKDERELSTDITIAAVVRTRGGRRWTSRRSLRPQSRPLSSEGKTGFFFSTVVGRTCWLALKLEGREGEGRPAGPGKRLGPRLPRGYQVNLLPRSRDEVCGRSRGREEG